MESFPESSELTTVHLLAGEQRTYHCPPACQRAANLPLSTCLPESSELTTVHLLAGEQRAYHCPPACRRAASLPLSTCLPESSELTTVHLLAGEQRTSHCPPAYRAPKQDFLLGFLKHSVLCMISVHRQLVHRDEKQFFNKVIERFDSEGRRAPHGWT
ncbi:hypothetical protein BgiBS90_000057 [Biomphalaria glabrata]|nr:hypothetical protein BgiBS90_000057 [Biomphalaria glabrata]